MFIGRDFELKTLENLYASGKFEFVVIYGRRRVGKTALINHFLENKDSVYFMGVESNAKQNLENFSKSIFEESIGFDASTTFLSFQAALEYVFQLSVKKRIVLAIDEYPYVARCSDSFASTLQLLIDKYKEVSQLMLILCGSSMSYMEDQVLSYKAPLYGRRTAQIKLLPFDFSETCRALPRFTADEKALLYGVIGGTPQYLLQIDNNLSVEENIKKIFLNPMSAIYEEPTNLLKQEVREPSIYNAVISAIAAGASKMSEISGKVGAQANVCAVYVKNLLMIGILRKEFPYGDKTAKKAIYAIDDNMFRFWYRFVPDNNSLIARGATNVAYQRIAPFLSEYMGRVFEEICTQYLWHLLLNGQCPVTFASLGRWWGNDAQKRTQTEIDIMGEQDSATALFAECKWTNEKVDVGILDALIDRSRLFGYPNKYLYLFSKSGFTKGCREKATAYGNTALVCFSEMMDDLSADNK